MPIFNIIKCHNDTVTIKFIANNIIDDYTDKDEERKKL